MSGTIRNNGQNSAREIARAGIQAQRRAAQNERRELRAMDERALSQRTAPHSGAQRRTARD